MPINSPDVFDSITDAKIVSGTGGGGVAEVQVQDSFGTTLNQRNTIKFLRKEFRVSAGGGTNQGDVVLTGYQDLDTGAPLLGENGDANHFRFYNWQTFLSGTVGLIYSFYYVGSNQFRLADNNALNTTHSYLGIKPFLTPSNTMIVEGVCKVDKTNWTLNDTYTGAPVYLDSNGLTTDAVPSTAGDFVRVVGYIINYAQGIIYFKPDDTVIKRK
jgi:hypothetical protein